MHEKNLHFSGWKGGWGEGVSRKIFSEKGVFFSRKLASDFVDEVPSRRKKQIDFDSRRN